jgi:hypothetical protein
LHVTAPPNEMARRFGQVILAIQLDKRGSFMTIREILRLVSAHVLSSPGALALVGGMVGLVGGSIAGAAIGGAMGQVDGAVTGAVIGGVGGIIVGGICGFLLAFVGALVSLCWAIGAETILRKNPLPVVIGVLAALYALVRFLLEPGPIDAELVVFGCSISFLMGAAAGLICESAYTRLNRWGNRE